MTDSSALSRRQVQDVLKQGFQPYKLTHADSSRFKAAQELLLLEDHLMTAPCNDCMQKHAMCASRLMVEAATLDDGRDGDLVMAALIENARQRFGSSSKAELARQIRLVRKQIAKKLGLSS